MGKTLFSVTLWGAVVNQESVWFGVRFICSSKVYDKTHSWATVTCAHGAGRHHVFECALSFSILPLRYRHSFIQSSARLASYSVAAASFRITLYYRRFLVSCNCLMNSDCFRIRSILPAINWVSNLSSKTKLRSSNFFWNDSISCSVVISSFLKTKPQGF